jgi:DNA-binding transcriptional LysR family regulator
VRIIPQRRRRYPLRPKWYRPACLQVWPAHCDQTIAACRLGADPAGRTFAATSLSTIVEFVANGQGVTLLPMIAVRKEAADPRIAIHPLATPGAVSRWFGARVAPSPQPSSASAK